MATAGDGDDDDDKMTPKLVPKRMNQDVSASSRISVLLPRPKHRRVQYFVARESGELLREWVQRNLEDSLGCYLIDIGMALLALFVVVFNAYVYWNGVLGINAMWMKGRSLLELICCQRGCVSTSTLTLILAVLAAVDFTINFFFTIEYVWSCIFRMSLDIFAAKHVHFCRFQCLQIHHTALCRL